MLQVGGGITISGGERLGKDVGVIEGLEGVEVAIRVPRSPRVGEFVRLAATAFFSHIS